MFKAFGFTISELLIVITIFSVLIWIAIPSFQELLIKNEANQIKKVLTIHIQKAKYDAILRHKSVVLCPSVDLTLCNSNWDTSLISFVDTNHNLQRESDEEILTNVELNHRYGSLKFQKFGKKFLDPSKLKRPFFRKNQAFFDKHGYLDHRDLKKMIRRSDQRQSIRLYHKKMSFF